MNEMCENSVTNCEANQSKSFLFGHQSVVRWIQSKIMNEKNYKKSDSFNERQNSFSTETVLQIVLYSEANILFMICSFKRRDKLKEKYFVFFRTIIVWKIGKHIIQ